VTAPFAPRFGLADPADTRPFAGIVAA